METKKRICSVTTVDITMEPFIMTQMEYMMEKGWDVAIICNMKPAFIERIPQGFHYYNVLMERSFNLWVAIKSTWRLCKIFRRERYDIVQYAATHAALYSSFAACLCGIPIRVHLQWGIYNYSEMGLTGKFYKFVEWLTCKFSTDVRPVSHQNLKIALEEGLFKEGKGKVLGQGGTVGVDLNDYPINNKDVIRKEIRDQHAISQTDFLFGFCGRISVPKGNNELLRTFKKIVAVRNDVSLILVGEDEGSIDRELMSWANECEKVVVVGRVLHTEIPRYMAAMDCLVHPTYREGFGMVLQEAMAMAVPIITTDIPGPSEVIENGKSGLLIQPQDEESLYAAMLEVVSHPEKYVQFGKNGRQRAEECFARDVMLQRIFEDKEELYNSKIAKR